MNILLTGSVAYDYLMSFPGYFRDHFLPDKLDTISLSFLVESMVRFRGGTAPNIAYTLALLGQRPRIFATVGEDFDEYRTWLEAHGVDTSMARVIPGVYTASFFANTDLSNAQIASFYPGAMAHAAELSLTELESEPPDMVMISPNDPEAMKRYVVECRELGFPYIYDPSQQIVRLDKGDLLLGIEGAKAVFVNDYEYALISKMTGLTKTTILEMAQFLVVTRGEAGAIIYSDTDEIYIPVVPAEQVVDPTGVGDAFRGGFLTAMGLGLSLQICGQMGALAATYCLEQRGPQNHHYSRTEFVQRFRQYFNDETVLNVLLE